MIVRCSWRRPKSIKDQVSVNIRCVVQVFEPDLVAGGIAVNLLQVAKRIGPQREAAEHEDLSGEKSVTLIKGAIGPKSNDTEEL